MTGTHKDFSNFHIQLSEDCAKVIVGGGEARRGRLQASARFKFGTQYKVRLEWYASLPWLAFRALCWLQSVWVLLTGTCMVLVLSLIHI